MPISSHPTTICGRRTMLHATVSGSHRLRAHGRLSMGFRRTVAVLRNSGTHLIALVCGLRQCGEGGQKRKSCDGH